MPRPSSDDRALGVHAIVLSPKHCMDSVVTLQHDRTLGRKGGREGGAPVFITVKRFNNKAQGRREGGAPWVQRQEVRGTPTGSDNMDGHILRIMS